MAESISSMVAWKLRKAIAGTAQKDAPRSGTATVQRRDSNGTVWVRLPGASMDTPVVGSVVASVAAGDTISYEIQGGRVNVTGNASDPAAGERAVGAVRKVANAARELARDAKAIAEATGQYFWHDDNGAHVSTEKDNPAGPQNTIWNSLGMLFRVGTTNLLAIVAGADSGMDVYDGHGNDEDNIIASHRGSGSRIGKSAKGHLLMTPYYFRTSDDGGNELFTVGMPVDQDGYIETTTEWTVTESGTTRFYLIVYVNYGGGRHAKGCDEHADPFDIDPFTLYVDDIETDAYTIDYVTGATNVMAEITMQSEVAVGSIVKAVYRSNFVDLGMSFGAGSKSDGYCAVALGINSDANGDGCFAEGVDTVAKGSGCHAEGGYYFHSGDLYTGLPGGTAKGWGTHAGGLATIARGFGQFVTGRANVEDSNDEYAFIIGNGQVDTEWGEVHTRSNAFAVTWDGDLEYSGTLNGKTWHGDTYGTASGGTTVLPAAGTYILVTGHNSTAALNGIWIVRTDANAAFRLAGGGNVTVTVSGTSVTVKTTSGTVNVYYQLCGN